jgi:hypothetical protein
LVKVPRPERFAVHKLIVADRRRHGADTIKARKDRMQAEILISKWRERLERSLDRSPALATLLRGLSD